MRKLIFAHCSKILILLFCFVVNISAQTADSFNPNPNLAPINAIAIQTDGKIIIAGGFTTVGGITRNRVARINTDGTLDTTFIDPNVLNDDVVDLKIQSDGKIVIVGRFTSVAGQTRNRIARLNTDGTLDLTFNPDANNDVNAVALQNDGSILVGGQFTTVGGQTRNRFAHLDTNGTLDTSFNPDPNDGVVDILVQPDNKILVAGFFGLIGGQPRSNFARLNANGTVDSLNAQNNNVVFSIGLQTDGKILIGGQFTSVGGFPRTRFARLNSDGTLDTSIPDLSVTARINAIVVQTDGKIVIGGDFTSVAGTTRNRIARINSDGSLDTTFDPNSNAQVLSLIIDSNGRILIGGGFTNIGGQPRNFIARLSGVATAASVWVSGRVTANGRGVRGARVTLTDAQGTTRIALTNPFGYYRFSDVSAGETHVFSVTAKRYQFTQSSQVLTILGETDDINFTADG